MFVELNYAGKQDEMAVLSKSLCQNTPLFDIKDVSEGLIIKADNLVALRHIYHQKLPVGKVDFIYMDPPFATNLIFKVSGRRSNTISQALNGTLAYEDTLMGVSYLEFIRERLILLREIMSNKSSIYVHIDYKIGHYIKLIMDEVFGINNFRSSITRIKCNPKNFNRRTFGNVKDMILFYTKTDEYTWNDIGLPYTNAQLERLFKQSDENGNRYTTVPLHAPGETINGKSGDVWSGILPPEGRHWRYSPEKLTQLDKEGRIHWSKSGNPRLKRYASDAKKKGQKAQDILEFKDPQNPIYPTEKNIEFIKYLIQISSDEGDVILDPFMGSGTTLDAALQLKRIPFGIDSSETAISVASGRLPKIQVLRFA